MSGAARDSRDDTRLGESLCPDCYNYAGAVLFNALALQLWRRIHHHAAPRTGPAGGLLARR
jgi:hypothetical protein